MLAPPVACLDALVGVSRRDCPCYETKPAEQALVTRLIQSTTGVYLDEEPNLPPNYLTRAADCEPDSMWLRLLAAKTEAIHDVAGDLARLLEPYYAPRYARGLQIGQDSDAGVSAAVGPVAVQLATADLPGAFIRVTHLGLLVQLVTGTAHPVEIGFYRFGEAAPLRTFSWTAEETIEWGVSGPDRRVYPVPNDGVRLDCDGSVYEIRFTVDATKFRVRQNELLCVVCTAARGDVAPLFSYLPNGPAHGLVLHTQLGCDSLALACALARAGDSYLVRELAELIRLRALARYVQRLTGAGATTTTRVLNLTQAPELVTGFGGEYEARLAQFVESVASRQLPLGCFTCRTGTVAARSGFYQ